MIKIDKKANMKGYNVKEGEAGGRSPRLFSMDINRPVCVGAENHYFYYYVVFHL